MIQLFEEKTQNSKQQVEDLRKKGDRWQGKILAEDGRGVGSRAQVKGLA